MAKPQREHGGAPRAPAGALPRAAPWLLFAVAPLLVFPWGYITGGMLTGGADVRVHLPDLHYAAKRLLSLDVLWAPDLMLGQPMLREPRFAIFYPLKQLLLAGDPVTGYGIYVYLHLLLAQAGMYLYLRALGAGRVAAVFAGLAFGFGGFLLGQRAHTHLFAGAAWAPWLFLFVERLLRAGRRRDYLGAALAFAMVPLAGALELAAYLLWAAALLGVARAVAERDRRAVLVTLLALVPAAAVASLQLLPSAALLDAAVPKGGAAAVGAGAWHPALLATMVLPTAPADASGWDLYARAGVAVTGCAIVAMVAARRAVAIAWFAVLVAGLVLMMGTNVPGLGDLIAALPLGDAFRHPARHGFEVSIALAVLAGLGVQGIRDGRRLPGRWWLWAGGAALLVGGAGVIGRGIAFTPWWDPPVARFLAEITRRDVALTTVVAAVWMGALAGGGRPRRAALAVAAIALLLGEARLAMRRGLPGPFPDYRAALARADFRAEQGDFARIIAPPPGVPPHLLPGNVALLAPNLQRLAGDVTAPGRAATAVLGLAPSGEPKNLADLRWSRLPEVFGATHLIMPDAVCSPLGFTLDQESIASGSCNSDTAPHALALRPPAVGCRYDLVPESQRTFRVRADLRQEGAGVATAQVRLRGGKRTTTAAFEPPRLDTVFRPHLARLDLEAMPPVVELALVGDGDQAFVARDVRLETARPRAVATLDPQRARKRVAAEVNGSAFLLRPRPGLPALLEGPLPWPAAVPRHGRFTIEVVARALEPPQGRLEVGLASDEPGFPAKVARVTMAPGDLSPNVNAFEGSFVLARVPPDARFRVRLAGARGEVEIQSVTLWAYVRDTGFGKLDPSFRDPLRATRVTLGPEGIRFPSGVASIAVPYHVPRRPVRVWVYPVKDAAGRGPVALAIRAAGTAFGPETIVDTRKTAGLRRLSYTFDVAPDARTIEIRARSGRRGPPTPEGVMAMNRPVRVAGVTGEEACAGRAYRPVRTLANGLTLYRNLNAMPRLYTAAQLFRVSSPGEARLVVRDHPDFLPGRSATVETDEEVSTLSVGVIKEQRFRNSRVEAVVDSPTGVTLLVVNDRFDPRWRASVDGAPARIYRVNGLVRGVVVPRGAHIVRLWYALPGATLAGSVLAILGILLALLVMPWLQRRLGA